MTIEQAIEHAEMTYKESRNGLQYALKRGETKFAERCKKDAEKYRQLAAWLRELQERREKDNKIGRGNARWLINSDGYYPYCSACMAEPEDGKMTDFCPSCGARMEGKIT